MKSLPNKPLLATLALVGAGLLGGLAPIAAKIALRELPPFTVLFIRLLIMVAVLTPLVWKSLLHLRIHLKHLIFLSLFWIGNVALFIVGIKYTTAVSSQLLYASVPILVLLENSLIVKERITKTQGIGILLGICGAALFIIGPATGAGFGTWYGNAIIFMAGLSYSFYVIFSRRFTHHVTSVGLTSVAAAAGLVVTFLLMGFFEHFQGLPQLASVSATGWQALVFLGLIVGVIMWFLYNWGIKYGSAIAASSTVYVSTLTSGLAGAMFFGETITLRFIFGGILLLTGVFLTSTWPLVTSKAKKAPQMV